MMQDPLKATRKEKMTKRSRYARIRARKKFTEDLLDFRIVERHMTKSTISDFACTMKAILNSAKIEEERFWVQLTKCVIVENELTDTYKEYPI